MDKQTYYTILESIGIRNNILTMIQALMTLEEAKDFLWDRYAVFTKEIENKLDVT